MGRNTLFAMIHANQLVDKSVLTHVVRFFVRRLAPPVKNGVHGEASRFQTLAVSLTYSSLPIGLVSIRHVQCRAVL